MLLFLDKLFDQFIGKTAKSVAHAAEAKLKRETIGKAQAKVSGAESKMRQKALRSMDKVSLDSLKKKK